MIEIEILTFCNDKIVATLKTCHIDEKGYPLRRKDGLTN